MEQEDTLSAIYLEWIDPADIDAWTPISDISEELNLIRSVGFLIRETEKALIICLNRDLPEHSASMIMIIPKILIRRRMEVVYGG